MGGGGEQVIFLALMATLDAPDEVIIPAPCWVSYPDMVLANDGTPVILDCPEADGFKLTPRWMIRARIRVGGSAHKPSASRAGDWDRNRGVRRSGEVRIVSRAPPAEPATVAFPQLSTQSDEEVNRFRVSYVRWA